MCAIFADYLLDLRRLKSYQFHDRAKNVSIKVILSRDNFNFLIYQAITFSDKVKFIAQ